MFKWPLSRINSGWWALLNIMPDTPMFWRLRIKALRKNGCIIGEGVSISPNVRITGKFMMGNGSSIAHNCTISGATAGVFLGDYVMIAAGCSIIAFNHGFARIDIPMVQQQNVEASIIIEDDVWIASNCTITKGVTIGRGSVIGANSVVTKDVPPYSIAGGVPAKVIKTRFPEK